MRKLTGAVVCMLEVCSQVVPSTRLMARVRPKQYYTVPDQTLDRVFGEIEEGLQFFVVQFQKILYAENVTKTIAVSQIVRRSHS